jgi:hypothetical protein
MITPAIAQPPTIDPAAVLERVRTGGYPTTDAAMTDLIGAWIASKARAQTEQDALKDAMSEIVAETGQERFQTPAGTLSLTASSVSVRYDTKALDALCASNDDLDRILGPHRKESMRAGTLRVTK